jgi:23S rRNA (pseudouridine1915-N3)-methyltransferase
MLLRLLAAGTRMPDWVNDGYAEYASRLKHDYKLELKEIPLGQRTGTDAARAIDKEGERMIAALDPRAYVVTLQVTGRAMTTEELARFLEVRANQGQSAIDFCIGGPDGIAAAVDARAQYRWSLSTLTLPHGLVRVIAAEALYRAVSVIKRLPYHRGS